MKKKKTTLWSLIVTCVFALVMGIMLIPQTASAAEDPGTIYWAVDSNQNLTISDQAVQGSSMGNFLADTVFTDIDGDNPAPWGSVKTAKVEGSPTPQYTDYWFSGCEELETVDITDLDLSKCESMIGMFKNCQWLEIVNLYNADISACTNFSSMLEGCSRLQMLVVGPSWCNLPSENMRATFPTGMDRRDVNPSQHYNGGTLVPEYIPSDAGLNIYVINWSNAINDANSFVKVLWKIHALPGIEEPELQDAVETALFEYNKLANRVKVMVPEEALAILDDALNRAGISQLPRQIKIKWSSIDGENLLPPITYDIPAGGIKLNTFLQNNYSDICSRFAIEGYKPYISEYYYGAKVLGYNPMSGYGSRVAFESSYPNWPDSGETLKEFTIFYFYSTKSAGEIKTTANPLRCGTTINSYQQIYLTIAPEDVAKIHEHFRYQSGFLATDPDGSTSFNGTIQGGQEYYLCVSTGAVQEGFGYYYDGMQYMINGQPADVTNDYYVGKITAVHDPNSSGICKGCGKKVADPQNSVEPGVSGEAAEQAITSMTSDTDPKGSVFSRLAFKSKKQTKSSIKLNWNKIGNAQTYVLYGNKCGKGIKPVKIATSKGNVLTVKTISGKKLAKGTYYKFIIVALDKDNKVVSTSKLIHVATSGGKVGNHKKVTVKKSVTKKAKKLKKGKSLKLKAKAVKKSKKVKKHVGVRYESTNSRIAAVSAKGVVKANNKGTCYVYAYAQNGISKKIKITVK